MRSGRVYLYLQYYPPIRNPRTNKAIRWEALKLEMFPNPKTTFEREHNKSMIEMAEIIKSKRMMLLAGESYGFIDKTRKREDAIRYFEQVCKQKGGKWGAALLHFKEFMGGSCRFEELTEELCEKYKEWILNSENNNKEGAKLKRNSAAAYFSLFRAMLKIAYREHWLTKNLNDFITPIKTVKVSKPYLTLEELRTLADTPCENDVLKRASLFSCLTGLRISDIKTLRWEDLIKNQYGCYTIHKTIVKTGEIADNPISNEARSYWELKQTGDIWFEYARDLRNGKDMFSFRVYQRMDSERREKVLKKPKQIAYSMLYNMWKMQLADIDHFVSLITVDNVQGFICELDYLNRTIDRKSLKDPAAYMKTVLISYFDTLDPVSQEVTLTGKK